MSVHLGCAKAAALACHSLLLSRHGHPKGLEGVSTHMGGKNQTPYVFRKLRASRSVAEWAACTAT